MDAVGTSTVQWSPQVMSTECVSVCVHVECMCGWGQLLLTNHYTPG